MKSILIIVSLCSLLIIISGFANSNRSRQSVKQVVQCKTTEHKPKIQLNTAKKPKLSAMPRWHQVIPGMFH